MHKVKSNCSTVENIIYVCDLVGIGRVRLGQFVLLLNSTDEFLLCRLAKDHSSGGQRVGLHRLSLEGLLKGI
jgi:hypothetical protein